jgi:hypothetical protein
VVAAEIDVHQAGHPGEGVGVTVVVDALDQGRGAVADPRDGHPDATASGVLRCDHVFSFSEASSVCRGYRRAPCLPTSSRSPTRG